MTHFGHVVSFVCSKELLEPMRPLVNTLQGRDVEVYFGFRKMDEVIASYNDIQRGIDMWLQQIYAMVLRLSELVGAVEERPRVSQRQINRDNVPVNTVEGTHSCNTSFGQGNRRVKVTI